MPVITLTRSDEGASVILGEHQSQLLYEDVEITPARIAHLISNPISYGRELFDQVFSNRAQRELINILTPTDRLMLICEDPGLSALPWEYLRTESGDLLASRCNFLRGLPESAQQQSDIDSDTLEIVAVPVSPIDESRVIATNREYKNLLIAVQEANKSLQLTCVRPATLLQLEQALRPDRASIVHFMGHSNTIEGRGVLVFEDSRGCTRIVSSDEFADALDEGAFLVILNSCLSAQSNEFTHFGNIARNLVRRRIPYALGMQFPLPDDGALELSRLLFRYLLTGRDVEEAIRRTRRGLLQSSLENKNWVAGVPVLYTSQRERIPAIQLSDGRADLHPDPARLERTWDISLLPFCPHFIGRVAEITRALDALLGHQHHDFVVLHGLGGAGKTALARVIAERVGWHYGDWGLAYSFESFVASGANGDAIINEQFATGFYDRLARFYGIDTQDARYQVYENGQPVALQQAILQRRRHLRSLLILDNVETLLQALDQQEPSARQLAAFIKQLGAGEGDVLLTSRGIPPADWGKSAVIPVAGLSDDTGARLFLTLLSEQRKLAAASKAERVALSRRVQGHPLSIRLLAARFNRLGVEEADTHDALELAKFLADVEEELRQAELNVPDSLYDQTRQRTVYACVKYSVSHLSAEQLQVLSYVSLFETSCIHSQIDYLTNQKPGAEVQLDDLVQLSLLERDVLETDEGLLPRYSLHPVVRWYAKSNFPPVDDEVKRRYAELYVSLLAQVGSRRQGWSYALAVRSLPDFENVVAGPLTSFVEPDNLVRACLHLGLLYYHLSRFQDALRVYKIMLGTAQESEDERIIAIAQGRIAPLHAKFGKFDHALSLLRESLNVFQKLNDDREAAMMRSEIAYIRIQQGQADEAIALYEEVLPVLEQRGEMSEIAGILKNMCDTYIVMGRSQEAVKLARRALEINRAEGNNRSVAVDLRSLGMALQSTGELEEAFKCFQEALGVFVSLGDLHSIASTKGSIATLYLWTHRYKEAAELFEDNIIAFEEVRDPRSAALARGELGKTLAGMGEVEAAEQHLRRAESELLNMEDLNSLASFRAERAQLSLRQGNIEAALQLYQEALQMARDMNNDNVEAHLLKGLGFLYENIGRMNQAKDCYSAVLSICQRNNDRFGVAQAQYLLAEVIWHLGDKEAEPLFQESMDTLRELRQTSELAVAQFHLGQWRLHQGRFQEAGILCRQALPIFEAEGNRNLVATTQILLGVVLQRQQKTDEAEKLFQQARASSNSIGDKRHVGIALRHLGEIAKERKQFDEASRLHEEARGIFEAIGDRLGDAISRNYISECLTEQGQLEEGIRQNWQSHKILQELALPDYLENSISRLRRHKQQMGTEAFDQAWANHIRDPMPEWLQGEINAPVGEIRQEISDLIMKFINLEAIPKPVDN